MFFYSVFLRIFLTTALVESQEVIFSNLYLGVSSSLEINLLMKVAAFYKKGKPRLFLLAVIKDP